MIKRFGVMAVAVVCVAAWTAAASAQSCACCASTNGAAACAVPAGKVQTTCPVMGGAIDKSQYVDYEGKRIYVCCKGCIATVKKNPAKYVKQLEAAGVTLETVKPAEATKTGAAAK